MINKADITVLKQHLFDQPGMHVYAILDGASVPDLREEIWQREQEQCCLIPGDLETDMAEVAPYLIRLEANDDFTDWVLSQGWGKHWGIFAVSEVGLRELRGHLRSLLKVYDPDGKPLHFRFYDPRVFRVYLPTCNPQEADEVFGPVAFYAMEGEDPKTMLMNRAVQGAAPKAEAVTVPA